jgi:hypothetical protein
LQFTNIQVGLTVKNVLKNAMKATAVATVVAGAAIMSNAQEAAAFNINAGSVLELGGIQNVVIGGSPDIVDFNGAGNPLPMTQINVLGISTDSFAPLAGSLAQITNLSVSDISAGKNFWITLLNNPADFTDDIIFNLDPISSFPNVVSAGGLTLATLNFTGKFLTLGGESLADGFAVAAFRGNSGQWGITINAVESTPIIPTPALLPGFAAMGLGMLRKKRQAKTAVA